MLGHAIIRAALTTIRRAEVFDPLESSKLVLRGPLHMIDNQDLHGAFLGL